MIAQMSRVARALLPVGADERPDAVEALTALGVRVGPPSGAPSYLPVVRAGDLLLTAGQLPMREGRLIATGRLGDDLDIEDGYACAQWCMVNALAAIQEELGDLSRVRRVVKLVVYVASGALFTEHATVANGASDLLERVFCTAGEHVRSAVGVSALPFGAPVEAELIVQV